MSMLLSEELKSDPEGLDKGLPTAQNRRSDEKWNLYTRSFLDGELEVEAPN